MCLSKLVEYPEIEFGYKVFKKSFMKGNKKLYGDYQLENTPRPVGRWLDAYSYSPEKTIEVKDALSRDEFKYPAGWHVFHSRKDALRWKGCDRFKVIRKVMVRETKTTGYQYFDGVRMPITVCQYIKIVPKKRRIV